MLTSSAIKRLGMLLIVAGAPLVHYTIRPVWLRTSTTIAAGLMMIFFSKESIDDERVDLKLRAVHAAFSVSFTLTLIVNWFMNRDFDVTRDFDGTTAAWR